MALSFRASTVMCAVIVALCLAVGFAGVAAQDGGGRGGAGRGGRGQGPARDAAGQERAAGTGVISGTVTLSGSDRGVRHAQVTLSGGGGRGGRSTTTDEEGRFTFIGLAAGRFTLTASKPGFASIAYGAKKPGRQGTPIQLAEGQLLANVNLELPRGSVLTGVVVDELGDPSPNTQVRAYRFVLSNGEPSLQSAGQSQTDDRGIYRIFQLLPGNYLVSAVPRSTSISAFGPQLQAQIQPLIDEVQAAGGLSGMAAPGGLGVFFGGGRGAQLLDRVQAIQQQFAAEPGQTTGYAPVYYPGTTSPSEAARITLGTGEERGGVDFQLQLVPTAKVQGQVTGADVSTMGGMQVVLQRARQQDVASVPGLGTSIARVDADGTFTFQNVTPGDYRIIVRAPIRDQASEAGIVEQGGRLAFGAGQAGRGRGGRGRGPVTQVLWAATDVSVAGHDVAGLSLTLQPGMTVSGRLTFESTTAQAPADLTVARVNLVPSDGQNMMGALPQEVDAQGNFSITGVVPGRYTLRANLRAGGRGQGRGGVFANDVPAQNTTAWSLKSALLNGRDVLDFPLEIEPNQNLSGAVLTFTDRTQELSGTLQDTLGRPTPDYTIVLFPADNRYWVPQSRRILSTRPGTDGRFTLRGFPAGQYRLAAVTDAEPGEWFDPAFLTQILPASMPVTIGEGEKQTQDIRLAGAPQ